MEEDIFTELIKPFLIKKKKTIKTPRTVILPGCLLFFSEHFVT